MTLNGDSRVQRGQVVRGGGTRKQRARECGKHRDLSVGRKLVSGGCVGPGGMSGGEIHGVSRNEN